jgi:hypothetical protein
MDKPGRRVCLRVSLGPLHFRRRRPSIRKCPRVEAARPVTLWAFLHSALLDREGREALAAGRIVLRRVGTHHHFVEMTVVPCEREISR